MRVFNVYLQAKCQVAVPMDKVEADERLGVVILGLETVTFPPIIR